MPNVYKIRQKSTGLFSSGGMGATFTKVGKSWALPQLKCHLRLPHLGYDLSDIEIVECEMKVLNTFPAKDFLKKMGPKS